MKKSLFVRSVTLIFSILVTAACSASVEESIANLEESQSMSDNSGQEDSNEMSTGLSSDLSAQPEAEATDLPAQASEQESAEESTPQFAWNRELPEEATVWDNVLPTNGALMFYVYDGDTITERILFDRTQRESVLSDLLDMEALRKEDWEPEQVTFPLYVLSITGADGRRTSVAWSDGCWISPNGVAYDFAYDFEDLITDYAWESRQQVDYLPGLRFLSEGADGWYFGAMLPGKELPSPPSDIQAVLVSLEGDVLTVKLSNTGETDWGYGEYFELEAKLDGAWYQVPLIPDAWGFDDIGLSLSAGETQEKAYDFSHYYGSLPPGAYRLVTSGLAIEFDVE